MKDDESKKYLEEQKNHGINTREIQELSSKLAEQIKAFREGSLPPNKAMYAAADILKRLNELEVRATENEGLLMKKDLKEDMASFLNDIRQNKKKTENFMKKIQDSDMKKPNPSLKNKISNNDISKEFRELIETVSKKERIEIKLIEGKYYLNNEKEHSLLINEIVQLDYKNYFKQNEYLKNKNPNYIEFIQGMYFDHPFKSVQSNYLKSIHFEVEKDTIKHYFGDARRHIAGNKKKKQKIRINPENLSPVPPK